MAQLTAEQVERTIEACRVHLTEMGETFRTSLDCDLRLKAGEARPFAADVLAPFVGPGLAVSLVVGEQGMLLLIPEPIPLPPWYREPLTSENNRLQTFAHELSLQVLPDDLPAERYFATFAADLKEYAEQSSIDSTATVLELPVFQTDAADSDASIATILMILPANLSAEAIEEAAKAQALAASMELGSAEPNFDPDVQDSEDQTSDGVSPSTGLTLDQALRALRILNVPVTVSVRLAERKMPLGQIVALVPGALVTFNKSCEDLLDLFVNNYRYSHGEAIKIGEHFGLKIAKIGTTEERKEHSH
jgi:flagellar motor switch protein FliN/FliY